MVLLTRFLNDENGATAIEYGLIAGLISVVIITALTGIGTKAEGQVYRDLEQSELMGSVLDQAA